MYDPLCDYHENSLGCPLVEVVRPCPRSGVEPGNREKDVHLLVTVGARVGQDGCIRDRCLRNDGCTGGIQVPKVRANFAMYGAKSGHFTRHFAPCCTELTLPFHGSSSVPISGAFEYDNTTESEVILHASNKHAVHICKPQLRIRSHARRLSVVPYIKSIPHYTMSLVVSRSGQQTFPVKVLGAPCDADRVIVVHRRVGLLVSEHRCHLTPIEVNVFVGLSNDSPRK